jgi:hypothetical protein
MLDEIEKKIEIPLPQGEKSLTDVVPKKEPVVNFVAKNSVEEKKKAAAYKKERSAKRFKNPFAWIFKLDKFIREHAW